MLLQGKALCYGDDIDTDRIIPGKYTKTLDFDELAAHVMEDLDVNFRAKLRPGDFVIAGNNFGCGSSREQAPVALKHSGVAAIVAKSFARIFFRNAINIGLPLVQCNTDAIADGDELQIDFANGEIKNHSKSQIYLVEKLPPMMTAIMREGGLENYLKKFGDFPTYI